MDLGLRGKRVLVQGASTGIGFGIAKGLAHEGAKVAICARNKEHLQRASLEIPGILTIPCDLDEKGASKKLVKDVIQAFGGIDILVTNTGGPKPGLFEALSIEDWQKGFEKLFLSPIESILEALPHMKAQKWGRIILNTSTAAKEPIHNLTLSSSLRAGLLGFMKALSQQIAKDGITVNALLPGYIRTERLKELHRSEQDFIQEIPVGRLGELDDVGAIATFLASKQAEYITGQAIACDGGRLRGI